VQAPAAFRRQLLDAIPRLRRYARSLAFDAATADDLTQQALERALSHWQQFDPQREMGVWLLSIAHNAHLDNLRRDARLSFADPAELQRTQDVAQHADSADSAHHPGLRLDLEAALARLPAEQRQPLLLVCVEQLSYAEAAEVLRIPLGTVMSRVCRARAVLRAFLDGQPAPVRDAATPRLKRVV
jgi:RNA polymerase sigma-70 factor, ECF subfamily